MLSQLLTNPVYITFVLLLLVVIAEWLSQQKFFKYLGSSLIAIILAAVLANAGIIPSSQNAPPLYDGVFTYIAPLAIFYLLLDVKLKDIKKAGLPMLTMFFIGSACTVVAVLVSYLVIQPQQLGIENSFALSGMFAGTYIGGSANLNAVALHYGVINNGTLYAAINAADNIITAVWLIVTLVVPRLLQRILPRIAKQNEKEPVLVSQVDAVKENVTVTGFTLLLALGAGSLFVSQWIHSMIPKVPMILVLTTLALVLAQVRALHKVHGGDIIGFLFVLLFLAVIGAYCDIHALVASRAMAITLMLWVTLIVVIHGVLIFLIGGVLKKDWSIISIASNANIGGPTTAAVLATSLNRSDLRLPAILVGSVGAALGTYVGIMIAEYLR